MPGCDFVPTAAGLPITCNLCLQLLAKQLLQLRGNTVAVVGHAHMTGVEQAWRQAHGDSSVQCA